LRDVDLACGSTVRSAVAICSGMHSSTDRLVYRLASP